MPTLFGKKNNIGVFIKRFLGKVLFLVLVIIAGWYGYKKIEELVTLKEVIKRLEASSRVAEVIVTRQDIDPLIRRARTTIKFLEYDTLGSPLPPKYFTFSGDIIQFQSLVIRFDDIYVEKGHPLKGKSAYLFMKVFMLDNERTEVYDINQVGLIPTGYEVKGNAAEKKMWKRFWMYMLEEKEANREGIRNVQIEAPGTKFMPGYLYTIHIEHDGGLYIGAAKLPQILEGELHSSESP